MLGLQSARTLFGYLGCLVLPGQICLSDVESLIFGETLALSPQFDDHILNTLQQFLDIVKKHESPKNGDEKPANLFSFRASLHPDGLEAKNGKHAVA